MNLICSLVTQSGVERVRIKVKRLMASEAEYSVYLQRICINLVTVRITMHTLELSPKESSIYSVGNQPKTTAVVAVISRFSL